MRIAAAESLGAQNTKSAAEVLWRERGDESSELGKATRRILVQDYPELYRTCSLRCHTRTSATAAVCPF